MDRGISSESGIAQVHTAEKGALELEERVRSEGEKSPEVRLEEEKGVNGFETG